MSRSMAIRIVCAAASVAGIAPATSVATPDVPGFVVETYVLLPDVPGRLSFDYYDVPGTLYVGRGGAFTTLIPVFKIPPGGPAEEFGNTPLSDTDVVLYDSTGAIAPLPGSVLVGGYPGHISAILPNGDVVEVFPPGSGFVNPAALAFDTDSCLLFPDWYPGPAPGPVLRACADDFIPTVFFQAGEMTSHIAVHSSGTVLVSTQGEGAGQGNIFAYCAGNTTLVLPGLPYTGASIPIAIGRGGVWGTDVLYAMSGTELLLFEFDFSVCPPQLIYTATIGTGFDGVYCDIAFGPDGALYISDCFQSAVFRLVSDCNGNGINDQCDIDCGTAQGLCDLAGCGLSFDCNTNGIPDECENQPPEILCIDPIVLWSPNHDLIDVSSAFSVTDPDGDEVTLSFRVISDESETPETGDGTGRHARDFKTQLACGDEGLFVRSERRGPEDGRCYVFVITADDGMAQTTAVCIAAVCPHDQNDESLADVLAQADAAAIVVQGAVDSGADLPPAGLHEHGLSDPLGPKQ